MSEFPGLACVECHCSPMRMSAVPGTYRCDACGAFFRPPAPATVSLARSSYEPWVRGFEPLLGVLWQLAWSIVPTALCIYVFFFGVFGRHGDSPTALWFLVGIIGAPTTALAAPLIAAARLARIDRALGRILPRGVVCLFSLAINIAMIIGGLMLFSSAARGGAM